MSVRPVLPVLAAAMAVRGLNRTQTGHLVGCSGQYISHLLAGRETPSPSMRGRLAAAFPECDEDELFAQPDMADRS